MKILVKLPSKGRPKQLIRSLSRAMALASSNRDIHYQLTLDTDDLFTNTIDFDRAIEKLREFASIEVIRGKSSGKIHAVNRDITYFPPGWEILVLLSDDMFCNVDNWDLILRAEMEDNYPDTDGVLWFNDGYTGDKLNTLCILGKKYFDRFGYIYHPTYKSLWCDNEFMEVASQLGKQKYNPLVLFKHEHPANNGTQADELYKTNDKFYHQDEKNYKIRKSQNFGL